MSESEPSTPAWLSALLGVRIPPEGGRSRIKGHAYLVRRGILRQEALASSEQAQTAAAFGFKWKLRDTFDSSASQERMRNWLIERYGAVEQAEWWDDYGESPLVLDAGCGASFSAAELFGSRLTSVRYIGIDISEAVDVAARRFAERGVEGAFIQADLSSVPLDEASVDVVFSEGVLHHTDSTEQALKGLVRLLRPGGRFLFYVYRKKGPIREFTDDYIRDKLRGADNQQAWELLRPLSALGQHLGELNVTVNVPAPIELLDIPAGEIPLQRLFYWHVFKAFYDPKLSLEELNHINYDWYAPANAHRQTPDDVKRWCREAGLDVERFVVEQAGITVVARRTKG